MQRFDTSGLQRPQRNRPAAETVHSIELPDDCPEGPVLDPVDPAPAVDRHFANWENPLAAPHRRVPSHIYVVPEDGGRVLEYDRDRAGGGWPEGDRCLLAGEWTWQDYDVRARLCMSGYFTTVSADDSFFARPVAGLVLRLQDLRRYYFLALEKPFRLVLYRRYDDDWTELASARATTSRNIYSDLRAVVQGNRISAFLDGEEVFAVTDYAFRQGKAGVRFNVKTRIDGVSVAMTPGDRRVNRRRSSQAAAELESLQAGMPAARWQESVPLPEGAGLARVIGRGDAAHWLAVSQGDSGRTLLLLSRQGEEIWRRTIGKGHPGHYLAVSQPDDGNFRIGTCGEGRLAVLDGETGKVLHETPAPDAEGRQVGFTPLMPCNVSGAEAPGDWILRDIYRGGNSGSLVFAFNAQLEHLWTTEVRPFLGHGGGIAAFDIHGDGRDALLAGGTLIGPDGRPIWLMEGYEDVEELYQGHHIDSLTIGNLSDDEEMDPVAVLIASSAGVYFLDGLTGEIIQVHRLGHAQGKSTGRFRPEEPGIQVMVGCRWGNYGVHACYSGRGEELSRFQPDYTSQGGQPVNWLGDGQEHVLFNSSEGAIGLYDGWGRRLLPMDELQTPAGTLRAGHGPFFAADVIGDPRDELVAVQDGRIHIFACEHELGKGRVYAPRRRYGVSEPRWQEWSG